MSPDERELRLLVVKVEIRQQRLPALGCMTGVTGDRQFAVRIRVIDGGKSAGGGFERLEDFVYAQAVDGGGGHERRRMKDESRRMNF